jgi:hypothetical protein
VEADDCGITFGTILDISTHITLFAGVNVPDVPDQEGNGARVISKSNGGTGDHWCLSLRTNRVIDFRLNNSVVLSSGAIPYGTDVTIGGVYDGVNRYHYIDGALDKTTATTGAISTGTPVGIGCNPSSTAGRTLDGIVRFAYVWNRALTPSEIALLHREPYCMFEQPVIWVGVAAGVEVTATPKFMHYYTQKRSQ